MSVDQVLHALLERLWTVYCDRVEYARRYVELVTAQGGQAVNDHIAFRTLNTRTGTQPPGIAAIERVVLPLGYSQAGAYTFVDKNLSARHYQHPDPKAPKIFISMLPLLSSAALSASLIVALSMAVPGFCVWASFRTTFCSADNPAEATEKTNDRARTNTINKLDFFVHMANLLFLLVVG